MPRHTFTATLLWQLFGRMLAHASTKAAAQSLPLIFPLETIYHLLVRLRRRLDAVRCLLCRQQGAPVSFQTDPLRQTVEHVQSVFKLCPVSEFQLFFQQPFLG